MKEKMKLFLVIMISVVISSTISITATTLLQANQVSYKTSNGEMADVNSALDRLFDAADINGRLGNTDISSIGDGTITGAVNDLNYSVENINQTLERSNNPDIKTNVFTFDSTHLYSASKFRKNGSEVYAFIRCSLSSYTQYSKVYVGQITDSSFYPDSDTYLTVVMLSGSGNNHGLGILQINIDGKIYVTAITSNNTNWLYAYISYNTWK